MIKGKSIVVIAIVALVVSACNFPFAPVSENALATSIAETVEAMEEEIQQPTLALPTPTPIPPAPTATLAPTEAPKPTATTVPCLFASFVSETVPDKTKFSKGENFTKSWTLKNTGTCDWNKDYKIVYKSGDQMGGPDKQKIGKEVDPGETIKIELTLQAPNKAGTYKGTWVLETDKGVQFGLNGVTVVIVVE